MTLFPSGFGKSGAIRLFLVLLLLSAFALRMVHLSDMAASPVFDHPVMDAAYHDSWAKSILEGRPITDGAPYFRAPLYPWFLAAAYRLGGGERHVARIAQALFGVLTLGLVFHMGRRLFGGGTALLAVLLGTLYPLAVYFDGELLITPLALFLDTLLLAVLLEADRRRRAMWWGAAGVVLGLAALARPNILLFAPLIPIWLFLGTKRSRFLRDVAVPTLLVAAASLAVIGPVTWRNAREGGEVVLISWQGGLNFYLGNHPGADGWSATAPGMRKDWWGGYEDGIRIPQTKLGRKLRYREISNYWFARGIAFIQENPAEATRLFARKAYLLLRGEELSNNQILSFSGRYSRVFRNLPVAYGVLSPLALLGMVLAGRGRGRRLLLFYFFAYSATLVLFFVCSRFRMPLLPVILLFAAAGIVKVAQMLRRAPARGMALLAAVVGLTALLNIDFGIIPPVNLALGYEGEGVSLLAQGRNEEAAGRFREAIAHDPSSSDAYHDLGVALRESGKFEGALTAFREALRLDPDKAEAYNNLGLTYGRMGRVEEAIAAYRKGIAADRRHPGLHANLAMLLHNEGRYEEAIEEYRAFVRTGAVDGRVHTNLALCLEKTGQSARAEKEYRLGVRLAPAEPVPALRLAEYLERSGRPDEAREVLEEACRAMPDRMEPREALEQLKQKADSR